MAIATDPQKTPLHGFASLLCDVNSVAKTSSLHPTNVPRFQQICHNILMVLEKYDVNMWTWFKWLKKN